MIRYVKFQIFRDYLHGRVDIMAYTETGCLVSGSDGVITHKNLEAGEAGTPFMSFDRRSTECLQSLADALAEFGVMPKTGDNAKELSATRAHLEDMRRMANRAFDMLTCSPVANGIAGEHGRIREVG